MPGNNFLADSQANSRSFISRSSVQFFQRDENPLRKLFIQPDSVILHRDVPGPVLARLAIQMDNGGDVWFVVLQGIFNQVLQKLTHLKRVGVKIGQVPKGGLSLGLRAVLQDLR